MEKRDQASDAFTTEDVKHKCAASDEEFYDCLGDNSSPVEADSDKPDDVCGLSEKIKDVHVLDTRTDENMRGESQDDEHEPLSDAKIEEQEEEEKRRVEDALTDEEKEVRLAFSEAVRLYSKALSVCPLFASTERAILFANRAAALSRLVSLAFLGSLELNQSYMRARLRRAELQEKANKLDEALADYKEALTLDPSLGHARIAVQVGDMHSSYFSAQHDYDTTSLICNFILHAISQFLF
uniref:Tetratricopeptide repeat protein n=1 Tax=Eptatretus burgeri TaxID=7764 RepID=A0A8C4QJ24_EPTBU